MFRKIFTLILMCLGFATIPCLAADTSDKEIKTFLVRTRDGIPARITKQACSIMPGSSSAVADSMVVCLRASQRHDSIVSSLKRAGFVQNEPWANGLVIYEVVITPRDGIGYAVRTRYGSLEIEVRSSIHQDDEVSEIVERLDRAALVLMNGARIATPAELSSLR